MARTRKIGSRASHHFPCKLNADQPRRVPHSFPGGQGAEHTVPRVGYLQFSRWLCRNSYRYGFCFSAAGFTSGALAAADLGFEAPTAITGLGCQKSAEAEATSSGGLLRSGENRKSVDSVCSTDSAFTCRNFL